MTAPDERPPSSAWPSLVIGRADVERRRRRQRAADAADDTRILDRLAEQQRARQGI